MVKWVKFTSTSLNASTFESRSPHTVNSSAIVIVLVTVTRTEIVRRFRRPFQWNEERNLLFGCDENHKVDKKPTVLLKSIWQSSSSFVLLWLSFTSLSFRHNLQWHCFSNSVLCVVSLFWVDLFLDPSTHQIRRTSDTQRSSLTQRENLLNKYTFSYISHANFQMNSIYLFARMHICYLSTLFAMRTFYRKIYNYYGIFWCIAFECKIAFRMFSTIKDLTDHFNNTYFFENCSLTYTRTHTHPPHIHA